MKLDPLRRDIKFKAWQKIRNNNKVLAVGKITPTVQLRHVPPPVPDPAGGGAGCLVVGLLLHHVPAPPPGGPAPATPQLLSHGWAVFINDYKTEICFGNLSIQTSSCPTSTAAALCTCAAC